jgi:hypothetical protein
MPQILLNDLVHLVNGLHPGGDALERPAERSCCPIGSVNSLTTSRAPNGPATC